jgi:hypothetical protein
VPQKRSKPINASLGEIAPCSFGNGRVAQIMCLVGKPVVPAIEVSRIVLYPREVPTGPVAGNQGPTCSTALIVGRVVQQAGNSAPTSFLVHGELVTDPSNPMYEGSMDTYSTVRATVTRGPFFPLRLLVRRCGILDRRSASPSRHEHRSAADSPVTFHRHDSSQDLAEAIVKTGNREEEGAETVSSLTLCCTQVPELIDKQKEARCHLRHDRNVRFDLEARLIQVFPPLTRGQRVHEMVVRVVVSVDGSGTLWLADFSEQGCQSSPFDKLIGDYAEQEWAPRAQAPIETSQYVREPIHVLEGTVGEG